MSHVTLNREKPLRQPLILTEEQRMLKEAALDFFGKKSPVSALRQLRDTADPLGYDPQLWEQMAELGFTALTIPEAFGGLDFGYVGLGQVLEASGRSLAATPLPATVLLGTTALLLAGSQTQKAQYLPVLAGGGKLLTLALEEGPRHDPLSTSLTATQKVDGFYLRGQKTFVPDGHVADAIVVVARTAGKAGDVHGLSLFLVDASSHELKKERLIMVDSRNMARLNFEEVHTGSESLLGELHQGHQLLERILDIGRIGLAAEMLGSLQEAFERTLAYLKERKQFGVPIGAFQALQHRVAHVYCEIELCKSVVLRALQAIDQQEEGLSLYASMAKAKVSQVFERVSNEGIQMFGGIGMTDDEEIGFFLKRARVAQHMLGDQRFHLDRIASLKGF